MKIELKRIHYSERLSKETYAFSADLYIDGKKVGEASNQGRGGSTRYWALSSEGRQQIDLAETYCKRLPPQQYEMDGKTKSYPMNLEACVDRIVDDYVQQKAIQKFRSWVARKCKDSLVIGKPDLEVNHAFRFKLPIEQILSGPRGAESMTNVVARDVLPVLTEGKVLLNANIPEDILKSAGLKEGQYVKHEGNPAHKTTKVNKKGKSI